MIPEREYEFLRFRRDAERVNADALIVMLGTNDLLEGATAGAAAARMEAFLNRCYTACFGGGIGPAIMDALSVEDMSPEELVRAARLWGIDIRRFEI